MTTRDDANGAAADVIAPPVARLIALFHGELGNIRFPGLDANVLDAGADRVRAAAAELARVEALVVAARASLAEAEQQLLRKGERALAYARIYAEEAPAIAAALEGLVLARSAASPAPAPAPLEAPRRRGRPRKIQTDPAALEVTLFSAPADDDDFGPLTELAAG
jgi:hypothetical protein